MSYLVQKFGGTSVGDLERIENVAGIIASEDLRMYGYYFERDDETSISDRVRRAIISWEDLRRGKAIDLKSVRSSNNTRQSGEVSRS